MAKALLNPPASVTTTLNYANGQNLVTIRWTPPASKRNTLPVARYAVQFTTDNVNWSPITSIPSHPTTGIPTNANSRVATHTLFESDLFLYKNVQYRVMAVDTANRSGPPRVGQWLVPTGRLPSTPSIISFVSDASKATMVLQTPAYLGNDETRNNGPADITLVLQYRLQGSTTWNDLTLPKEYIPQAPKQNISLDILGLNVGSTYQFRVAAINRYGTGKYSSVSTFRIKNPARQPSIIGVIPEMSPDGTQTGAIIFWYNYHQDPYPVTNWDIGYKSDTDLTYKRVNIPHSQTASVDPRDNRVRAAYIGMFPNSPTKPSPAATRALQPLRYEFVVKAINSDGSLGDSFSNRVDISCVPSAPTIIKTNRSGTAIVSVSDPLDQSILVYPPEHIGLIKGEQLVYRIEYREVGTSVWTPIPRVFSVGVTPEPQWINLTSDLNQSIRYEIRAFLIGHNPGYNLIGRASAPAILDWGTNTYSTPIYGANSNPGIHLPYQPGTNLYGTTYQANLFRITGAGMQNQVSLLPHHFEALKTAANRLSQYINYRQDIFDALAFEMNKNFDVRPAPLERWRGLEMDNVEYFNDPLDGTIASCGVNKGYFVDDKAMPTSFNISINLVYDSEFSQQDWVNVFTHELCHALGLGIFWNLYYEPAPEDNFLNGLAWSATQRGYNNVVGLQRYKIPIETTGGVGTASSHWEDNYRGPEAPGSLGVGYPAVTNELMVGFYDAGLTRIISHLTLGHFVDLGYVLVKPGQAEGIPTVVSSLIAVLASSSSSSTAGERKRYKLNCGCGNHHTPINLDNFIKLDNVDLSRK